MLHMENRHRKVDDRLDAEGPNSPASRDHSAKCKSWERVKRDSPMSKNNSPARALLTLRKNRDDFRYSLFPGHFPSAQVSRQKRPLTVSQCGFGQPLLTRFDHPGTATPREVPAGADPQGPLSTPGMLHVEPNAIRPLFWGEEAQGPEPAPGFEPGGQFWGSPRKRRLPGFPSFFSFCDDLC